MQTVQVNKAYEYYIKQCIRHGVDPFPYEAWQSMSPSLRASHCTGSNIPTPTPEPTVQPPLQTTTIINYTPEAENNIRRAFKALMIREGHGSLMERVLWDIKGI
jgi:hypothetical protein